MEASSSKLLVVLVRHADREYYTGLSDQEQPISAKGQRATHTLGEKLFQQLGSHLSADQPVSVIFSSPFVRCQQTAKILAAYLQPRAGIHSVEALAASHDETGREAVRWTLNLLSSNLEAGCIVLVGHQPQLLNISYSLGEKPLQLKNSEAAALELEAKAGLWQVGSARLLWRLKG